MVHAPSHVTFQPCSLQWQTWLIANNNNLALNQYRLSFKLRNDLKNLETGPLTCQPPIDSPTVVLRPLQLRSVVRTVRNISSLQILLPHNSLTKVPASPPTLFHGRIPVEPSSAHRHACLCTALSCLVNRPTMANTFCKETDIECLLQDTSDFGVDVPNEDQCESSSMG